MGGVWNCPLVLKLAPVREMSFTVQGICRPSLRPIKAGPPVGKRAAARFPTGGPAFIGRKDGLQIPCTVIDISLTGASFKTNGQFQCPPIGEVVTAGNLRGRVVRSGDQEFAVNFLRPDEQA